MTNDPTLAYTQATQELLPDGFPGQDLDASSIIWYMIRIAHRAEHSIEFDIHRPLGWSWAGFRVMYNTYVQKTCEPAQLADILGVSRPTVTVVLNRLERDGYIRRTPSQSGKRFVLVSLTEAGEDAIRKVLPMQMAAEAHLLRALEPAKRKQLSELLRELYLSIETSTDTAHPPSPNTSNISDT